MEERIKFKKGKQRKFLDLVVKNSNCISIRGLLQFGFDISYSSLKNYYIERRMIPKGLFLNLCHIAKLDIKKLDFKYIPGNYGQIIGGKRKK